ncbi:hypothetical protein BJY52DRAFT_1209668 [Lactarius psammicola]|nr:hypothetical protein BJY52DRAFT_1209668 [Lactarius psammicola]
MALGSEPHKNSLSISLIDPIVFLHGVDSSSWRSTVHENAPPSILRGLLTLCLAKTTRISSIQVELIGQSVTSWLEGPAVRPTEMQDENKLFHATQTFFQAPQSTTSRRAISAPGEDEFVGRVSSLSPIHSPDSTHFFHMFDPPRGRERARGHLSADETIPQRSHSPTAQNSQPHAPFQEDVSMLPADPLRDDSHIRTWEAPSRPPLGELMHPISPTSSPIDLLYEGRSFSQTPSVPPSSLPSRPVSPASSVSHSSLSTASSLYLLHQHELPAPSSRRTSGGTRESSPAPPRSHSRDRTSARFSLAGVSNSILEAMRGLSGTSKERGRSRRSGESTGEGHILPRHPPGTGSEVVGSDEHMDAGDGWQEFKKGTVIFTLQYFPLSERAAGLYTFPISFSIPSCMPPTISCDYGSVTWRLKANVHRPGVFTPRFSASREVILVASPSEDQEDTEGITIERTWEDQMRYTLSVSGRMFPIGGTIPITLSFMPMAKVRIYKITVQLKEQVMFFTCESMIRRTGAAQRINLLSLEPRDKDSPLLPLSQAATDSPLHALLGSDDVSSELTAKFMGAGPWTLQTDLKVPNGSRTLHFSNKNWRAPIQISHTLKIVIRIERGDDKQMDPKTGKRKRFDIILQMPVHILSSLASAQRVALPRYAERQDAPSPLPAPRASWGSRRHSFPLSRHIFAPQSLITAGSLEPFVLPEEPSREVDTLYERSATFERLITGQQSEAGVVPPAYSATR